MSLHRFTLREIQPDDGPGIAKLITEFDGDLTTRFLVDPYAAIVHGTEHRTTGVVLEAEGQDGFVGMGTVRFGTVQYNGDLLPLAFLDGLKVREDFRGNKLGHQLASWRIQTAKEKYGDQCVIGTGMLHDNHASHAVASKWCTEFIESAVNVPIVPVRAKPPRPIPGITIHELEPAQYEEFAKKQNKYYSQYQLYPPSTANSIAHACSTAVEGRKPYYYFVAVDDNGNLLAGAQTWARGMLKSDTVNNLPAAIRAMNKLVHLLPPDFTIRDIAVLGFWHEAGQERIAQFLWEMMRWQCRKLGTTMTAALDARDPTANIISLKPWHQPRPKITIAIRAPGTLNREYLLFAIGRV
jgi:predicted N-acetyltransferase YhbS